MSGARTVISSRLPNPNLTTTGVDEYGDINDSVYRYFIDLPVHFAHSGEASDLLEKRQDRQKIEASDNSLIIIAV